MAPTARASPRRSCAGSKRPSGCSAWSSERSMTPITDVREISRIGYGFMASRALFAALDVDVFGRLAEGPKTLETLAADLGLTAGRLRALLTACVGLGLLTLEGDRYANAPASATYL